MFTRTHCFDVLFTIAFSLIRPSNVHADNNNVWNAQYGPQLYRYILCITTAVDNELRFAETQIKIAFERSTDLLQLISRPIIVSCAARCAYLVAKLPLIISSCRLWRRRLTVRSWNRDVPSIRRMTPYHSGLIPKSIRANNFRILCYFFFFFVMCLILERFEGVWCKLVTQTRQSPISTSKWSWENENANGVDNNAPPVATRPVAARAQFILPWWDAHVFIGWIQRKDLAPNHSFDIPSSKWSRIILLYGRMSECAGLCLASRRFCVGGFICCRSISVWPRSLSRIFFCCKFRLRLISYVREERVLWILLRLLNCNGIPL